MCAAVAVFLFNLVETWSCSIANEFARTHIGVVLIGDILAHISTRGKI